MNALRDTRRVVLLVIAVIALVVPACGPGTLNDNTLTAHRSTSPGSRLRQLARLVPEHRRGWSRDRGDINTG